MIETLSSSSDNRPDVAQLLEYRDLMIDIVRLQGRGIRYARHGERARTRISTEYMIPGAASEWSVPDRKSRTHLLRDRRYSASFRRIGEDAGRLIILESDSVRTLSMREGEADPVPAYETRRNIYRFGWDAETGVHEAEVLPIQIVSSAKTDAEVLHIEPFGIKDYLALDHEQTALRTANSGGSYLRYVNPFRETESPWREVDCVEMDTLLARTDDYGKELLIE